jgi:DNA ligase-3
LSNIFFGLFIDLFQVLATFTTKDDQVRHFSKILPKCTAADLYYLTKIIDHDLKINIGPKYALEALHPDAFKRTPFPTLSILTLLEWKITNNLKSVIQKAQSYRATGKKLERKMSLNLDVMTPVKPMLARSLPPLPAVDSRLTLLDLASLLKILSSDVLMGC